MPDSKQNNQPDWKSELDRWDGQQEAGWDKAAAWQTLQSRLEPVPKTRKRLVMLWPAAAAAIVLTVFLLQKNDVPVNPLNEPIATPEKTIDIAAASDKVQKESSLNKVGKAKATVVELTKNKARPAKQTAKKEPALAAIAVRPVSTDHVDSVIVTPVERLLQANIQTPLTPKKRRVFHLNEINTPQELLSVEDSRDQRRQSLSKKTEPENKTTNQRPSTWIISLNN